MSKLSKTDVRSNLKRPLFWISMIALSAVFAICVESYWIIGRVSLAAGNFDAVFHPQLWQLAVCFIMGMIIFPLMYVYWDKIKNILWKYRYLWAFLALFLCVVFEISGSSIGMWGKVLPSEDGVINDGVLFGVPRPIRSDEWAIGVPMNFSQQLNHSGAYKYFAETVRGIPTDSFITCGQPVWDFAIIFRPFYWGYLLFGSVKGLAFSWCARMIAIFMVTLDFSMLLTKKNKVLSVFAAVLVSFSPAAQWWNYAGGLMDMIIFGLLSIIIVNKYMNTHNYKLRFVLALLLAFCAGSFALLLYPSWEIPMVYVVITLLVAVAIKNWKNFKFSFKRDIPIIAIALIILVGSILYVFIKSADTISLVSGTVYPGSRFELGGSNFVNMFRYPSNLGFPFRTENVPGNVCESSSFFDFAPIGIIIAIVVIIKKRGKDVFLNCMVICNLFFATYVSIGFPPFLSKITFLSNCQASRVVVILGFLNILILVRALSQMDFNFKTWQKHAIGIVCMLFVVAINIKTFGEYLSNSLLVFIVLLLTVMFILLMSANKKKIQILVTTIVVVVLCGTGLLVNPVQRGADVVFENKLYTSIKSVSDNSDKKWIVNDVGLPIINLPIMAGAPTINCTNSYPSLETWYKIDPEKKYLSVYNRYAHINVNIQSDYNSTFELVSEDSIELKLNIDDMEKLDVGYILSATPLEQLSNNNVDFALVETVMQYKIYEVVYK